jgi:Ser/Thr protein kinase RdoA (MazF antagonist)
VHVTRPYHTLTYRGQVGRMRVLSRVALPRFGIDANTPLRFLDHGENTTFRVEDADGRSYVLRIHRTNYQSPANIRSEMAWLEALAKDTDLVVPRPRAGVDGAYVQRVADPGVPEERSCVLLHWLHGRFAGGRCGQLYFERLGTLMAGLHRHAHTWKRPREFERNPWDEEALLGPAALWGSAMDAPGLKPAQRRLLERGRTKAFAEVTALGKAPDRYGLIHADLHHGNVLMNDGRMCAIDFDDCGEGWFLYDMLVAGGALLLEKPSSRRRFHWFLRAYREIMPVEDESLIHMEAFLVARRLSILGWLASRSDNPQLAARVREDIEGTCGVVRTYLDR